MADFEHDYKYEALKNGLSTLTGEVSRLAGMMERLVTVEERNAQTNQKVDLMKEQLQKDLFRIENANSDVKNDIKTLNQALWWATGAMAVIVIFLEPLIVLFMTGFFK